MTVTVIGPRNRPDPKAINVTSQGTVFKALSPFFLGPVQLWGGHTARNVENAWQFSKVYREHAGDYATWLDWAMRGWADKRAHRYPMGKGRVPLHVHWDYQVLDYVEARKRIYIPLYAAAAYRDPHFHMLRKRYQEEGELTLWDFDAYLHRNLNYSWDDVINDPERKMGHGFVLAMMLEGHL